MSKFNTSAEKEKETINHMGEKAIKQSPELELVSLLLTSFADDSYYRNASNTFDTLKSLISKVDKRFAAQAAIFARTEFGMRSITHVLASELARHISGLPWAKEFYKAIIFRPDDMMEIISYHTTKNGKVTNSMKKGFAKAFDKFDRYSLGKYRAENKSVKLVDIANIVHPVPTAANKDAINDLINGKLRSVDTWESELTKAGQLASNEDEKAEFKKDVWVNLIGSEKIGIFAVLRNLRNIIEQAPEALDGALKILTDPKRIKKSLILPFRYLTAYSEIEKLETKGIFEKDSSNHTKVLKAIEDAILISIDNLPVLKGKTVILSDNSGSMRGDGGGDSLTSRMSNTSTSAIANLFALMYWIKSDNTFVGTFGDKLIQPKLDRSKGLFDNFKIVDSAGRASGQSTERGIFDMFEKMIRENIIADTVVIFSDCQIGQGCRWYDSDGRKADSFMALFKQYKKINPKFRCYSVDLKSYGTTVFDGDVIKISGWSEKIFDLMKMAEQDKDALVNKIKSIEF